MEKLVARGAGMLHNITEPRGGAQVIEDVFEDAQLFEEGEEHCHVDTPEQMMMDDTPWGKRSVEGTAGSTTSHENGGF